MKSDRRHFRKPREPQELGRGYLARRLFGVTPDRRWNWRPPMLEGNCSPGQQWWSQLLGKPASGFSELDIGKLADHSVHRNLSCMTECRLAEFHGLRNRCRNKLGITDDECGRLLHRGPLIGFSELDIGDLSVAEYDAGLMEEILSSTELETMWLKDDELHYDRSLSMDSIRF